MHHHIHRFLLFVGLALLSAFTLVPPAHQIPEGHKFVPEVVCQKPPVSSLTLLISSGEVPKGEDICVGVTAKDFRYILSMQYSMHWDAKVLKFKSLEGFGLNTLNEKNFGFQSIDEGILTYSWYDQHLLGVTKPDGFQLYEVCFEAIGEAGSETAIKITSEPTVIEIADVRANFLDLRTEPGKVAVIEE